MKKLVKRSNASYVRTYKKSCNCVKTCSIDGHTPVGSAAAGSMASGMVRVD